MATVAIVFQSVCTGGCHLSVGVSIDGGAQQSVRLNSDAVLTALSAAEAPDIVTNILRIKFRGLTRAQARTALQAGFTMTV